MLLQWKLLQIGFHCVSVCVCVIVQVHAGNGQTGVLLLILSRQSALEGTIIHCLIMGDKPVK